MTGGLSQQARVYAGVVAELGAQPVIAPAEDLQADPELDPIEPGLTPPFGVALAAIVATAITAHAAWVAHGMPALADWFAR